MKADAELKKDVHSWRDRNAVQAGACTAQGVRSVSTSTRDAVSPLLSWLLIASSLLLPGLALSFTARLPTSLLSMD